MQLTNLGCFNMKFKKGDPVLIFRCPGWDSGGVGVITQIDTTDPKRIAYLVKDVTVPDRDMWTREEFMFRLIFDKPTLLQKIKWFFQS